MTIWRMRITCWILKTKNTHSEYVILNPVYCNNICTNAPHSYSIRKLPVFLHFQTLNDKQRVPNFLIRSAVYRFFENFYGIRIERDQ